MILIILAIAMLLPAINISAQIVLSNSGARNEAVGSSTATSADEWSLWRNPAGLSHVDKTNIAFSARQPQAPAGVTRSALAAQPLRFGTIAAGVSAFGDDIYNEQAASLAFANRIGIAGIGIRADILQLRIDGEAVRRTAGLTIGCTAKLSKYLSVGLCARNVNLPEWARRQSLPVVMNAGLSFKPSENFLAVAEVEKNTDFDPTLKGGFEYGVRQKFFARTGFNLFPNAAFGGFGLRTWRLAFDYAFRFAYTAGYSQQLSLSLHFNNSKRKS